MLKTQYIVGAVALITGTALGFMDIFLFDAKKESSGEAGKSTAFPQTAPRFMEKETKKDLSQITPSLSNMSVLIPHYAELSAAELKAEIKRLMELSPQGKSPDDSVNFAIRYLVLRLGRDFPGDVSSYIDNEMGNIRHYAGALLSEWSKNDFDGAMGYLMENRTKWNSSTQIFQSMVRNLAVTDPEKAMEWGLTQNGKIRQKALSEMFDVLVDNHREKIPDFAGKLLPEDWEKDPLLRNISEKWGSCDWESAMRWADTLSDKQKKEAIVQILGGLSSTDLKKATEEFKKQPQELQGDIAKVIVNKISYMREYGQADENSGRIKALDWIMVNAQVGENTDKLTRNLFGSSEALTPELIDRVKKLPDGSIRDNALRSMANMTTRMVEYGRFSYEEAFALTDQIKDPQTKKQSVMNNVENWVSNDPESARVWIEEKSGFTGEEKERQLKFCEESLKHKKENPREKRIFSKGMSVSVGEG